jgi:hypothetical protein
MSERPLAVGDSERAETRWQVFNTNYGLGGGSDPERRRKLGLAILSTKPWAARYDGSEEDYAEFATHREALDYALSEAAR